MKRTFILLCISFVLNSCNLWHNMHHGDPCNPDKQFKGKDRGATDKRNHS